MYNIGYTDVIVFKHNNIYNVLRSWNKLGINKNVFCTVPADLHYVIGKREFFIIVIIIKYDLRMNRGCIV